MKNQGHIEDFWFSNSKLKVKVHGETYIIGHEIDLFRIRPRFDFTFDTSLYETVVDDNDIERTDDMF